MFCTKKRAQISNCLMKWKNLMLFACNERCSYPMDWSFCIGILGLIHWQIYRYLWEEIIAFSVSDLLRKAPDLIGNWTDQLSHLLYMILSLFLHLPIFQRNTFSYYFTITMLDFSQAQLGQGFSLSFLFSLDFVKVLVVKKRMLAQSCKNEEKL